MTETRAKGIMRALDKNGWFRKYSSGENGYTEILKHGEEDYAMYSVSGKCFRDCFFTGNRKQCVSLLRTFD